MMLSMPFGKYTCIYNIYITFDCIDLFFQVQQFTNNIIYHIIYVNNRYSCLNIEINTIWNICDSGNTTQGVMSDILGKLFNIKTGFYGVLISNFARLNLSSIVDEANDKHMKPWNELCARNNIRATPLDPYMDKELLSSNHLYIDGTGISIVLIRSSANLGTPTAWVLV